jgi:hypothetical protein
MKAATNINPTKIKSAILDCLVSQGIIRHYLDTSHMMD